MILKLIAAIVGALTICAGALAQGVALPYANGTMRDLWLLLASGGTSDQRLQEAISAESKSYDASPNDGGLSSLTRLSILRLAQEELNADAISRITRDLNRLEASPAGYTSRNAKFLRAILFLKTARARDAIELLRLLTGQGTTAERGAAKRLLALAGGWFTSEMQSAELAELISSIGPIRHDFMIFPSSLDWEGPALAIHTLASQRYRAAWSNLGSDWLEARVESQILSQLREAIEKPTTPSQIRARAYAAYDFYELHHKSLEAWALLSSVARKYPAPLDEQHALLAREARYLLAGNSEAAALDRVRLAINSIHRTEYAKSWRLTTLKELGRRVEVPTNPVLAVEVQRAILSKLDALTETSERMRERFNATLELVRLQGLTGDFIRIAEALEDARVPAASLDEREDIAGGFRYFTQRLRLAEIQALELIPSRIEDADSKLRTLLGVLEQTVAIYDKHPDELLDALADAQKLGKAKSLEDYLRRKASAEIQADALASRAFIQLRRGEYEFAGASLLRALMVDLKRNTVCGSSTQLRLWSGLALSAGAMQDLKSSRGWFGEWVNCSGAASRESRDFAEALVAYGRALSQSRDWLAAEFFLQRGLRILSPDSRDHASVLATGRLGLAELALAQRRDTDAIEEIARAATAFLQFSTPSSEWNALGRQALTLLTSRALARPEANAKALALAFSLGQRISTSQATAGLSSFYLRASQKDPRLAALMQRTLEFQRRRDVADARLGALFSSVPITANLRARDELARELTSLESQLKQQSNSLSEFPNYQALVTGRPLALDDFSRPSDGVWLLEPNEVLVAYMQSGRGMFAVTVSRSEARLVPLDADEVVISKLVESIRSTTKFPTESGRPLPAFDLSAAQELHRRVWEPLKVALGQGTKVSIVAAGPLASLPFELLTTSNSPNGATTKWLDDEVVLRYVPSVSSMLYLSKVRSSGEPKKPIVVFGPPNLPAPASRAAGSKQGSFYAYHRMGDELRPEVLCDGTLRAFPPSVTGMARDLADALGGGNADVLRHERMLKSELKRWNTTGDLARYRNIAFVTHGLVAGQLVQNARTEPALVFSPTSGCQDPEIATTALLTASEVSELTLDADWVMLLACDTASADGTPGAEPLSGLARAFMFAGARALLVSHWSVEAKATSKLVQSFLVASRGKGRSEMLRYARLQLRLQPEYAHPAFWAGFSVVGADR